MMNLLKKGKKMLKLIKELLLVSAILFCFIGGLFLIVRSIEFATIDFLFGVPLLGISWIIISLKS